MRSVGQILLSLAAGLVVLAFAAPVLTALSGSLVPLVVITAVALIVVRLVFFHTRRW